MLQLRVSGYYIALPAGVSRGSAVPGQPSPAPTETMANLSDSAALNLHFNLIYTPNHLAEAE